MTTAQPSISTARFRCHGDGAAVTHTGTGASAGKLDMHTDFQQHRKSRLNTVVWWDLFYYTTKNVRAASAIALQDWTASFNLSLCDGWCLNIAVFLLHQRSERGFHLISNLSESFPPNSTPTIRRSDRDGADSWWNRSSYHLNHYLSAFSGCALMGQQFSEVEVKGANVVQRE